MYERQQQGFSPSAGLQKLDKANIYEETFGTTQGWLSFHTDSCKLLAQGCSESSPDIFLISINNPVNQQQVKPGE